MKKLISVLLCIAFVFSLVACETTAKKENKKNPDNNENFAGMANPMTEYDSLEKLNAVIGSKLAVPDGVTVSGEKYFTYATNPVMTEIQFNLNGYGASFRCAADGKNDISGIYADGDTIFAGAPKQDFETYFADDYKAARWFTLDGQYVFSVKDNGNIEKETFLQVCDNLREKTATWKTEKQLKKDYKELEGNYQDLTSKRATATVKADGANGVMITVNWSNSAFETNEWTMNAKYAEDGLLYYKDCKLTVIKDGKNTVSYENGEGYFSPNDKKQLVWNGAADENCKDCVFEKIK